MSNRTKIVAIPKTTTTTFLPTSIAGCSLWLDGADAATLTQGGGTVSQWSDKSGNARHITQATTGNQPTYSSTSNAVVFTGSQYLNIPTALAATTPVYTIFVVERRASANVMFFIGQYNLMSANTALILGYNSATVSHHTTAYVSDCQVTVPTYAGASEPMRINRYDYTGTTRATFINGGALSTTQSFSATLTTWSSANVGIGFGTIYGYIGNIHEIIFYNATLTTTQQQTIESYLAQKWGLTSSLAAGHPGLTTTVYTITVAVPKQKISSIPKTIFVSFLPTSIAGCVMWLDAADLTSMTLSGANVSQWTDKSGSGNSVVQASLGSQPTTGTTLNGLNTLYFTGKTMTYTGITVSAQTVFCIYLNNTFTPYGEPVAVGPFAFFYAAPSNNVGIGRTAVTDEVLANWSTNGLTTSKYTIYGGTVSVSGSTTSVLYFNGNQVASTTVASSGGSVRYNIGHYGGSTTGYLAEVLIYNSVLSQTNRQNVESYLAQKWGLTSNLVAGHPGLTTTVYGTVVPTVRQKIRFIQPAAPLVSYTQAYAYTGANQTFVVPATTTSITVYMWGAGGGGYYPTQSYGGAGCYLTGTLTVTPGETLSILVGQGGTIQYPAQTGVATRFGGGGPIISTGGNGNAQYNGSGGGRSAIQRSGADIVSAGAGGGCGTQAGSGNGHDGGTGSWTGTGGNGANDKYGLGGTQSAGGASQGNGLAGTALIGGRSDPWGGGGGGGYYGGGGGSDNNAYGSGGGGGSSYTALLTNASGSNGTLNVAPNTASIYYVSGVAVGGTQALSGNGGNGRVVLVYMA